MKKKLLVGCILLLLVGAGCGSVGDGSSKSGTASSGTTQTGGATQAGKQTSTVALKIPIKLSE